MTGIPQLGAYGYIPKPSIPSMTTSSNTSLKIALFALGIVFVIGLIWVFFGKKKKKYMPLVVEKLAEGTNQNLPPQMII